MTRPIHISVNGETTQLSAPSPLTDILVKYNPNGAPVAIAVNNEFVAKGHYADTTLRDGDTIDIVSPVGGG